MNRDDTVVDPALRGSEAGAGAGTHPQYHSNPASRHHSQSQQQQQHGQSAAAAADAAAALSAVYAPRQDLQQQQQQQHQPLSRYDSTDVHDDEHDDEFHDQDESPESLHSHRGDDPSQTHPGAGGADDAKRPRACEACRGLKVRCVPDAADPDGPCARCKKAKRNCVVTMPTRKRQKKTDSRVAELEKKIDALTASLHARAGASTAANASSSSAAATTAVPSAEAASTTAASTTAPVFADAPNTGFSGWDGIGRHGSAAKQQDLDAAVESTTREMQAARRQHFDPVTSSSSSSFPTTTGQKRKMSDRIETPLPPEADPQPRPPPPIRMSSGYKDVLDKGILTMDKAIELFTRYNIRMVRHFPAVVFPPTLSVSELRRTKPLLFLAIMAAAAGEQPQIQRLLVRELMQVLAEKIIISGEKSLEIIQALQVSVIWYFPPDHFEELKFYQLVHMAVVMAIDIGLGRRSQGRKFMPIGLYALQRNMYRRSVLSDPTTLEARRAWLTCYFFAAHTAMVLQRPQLLRWTKFAKDSMDLLQSSPDAAPTDKYFCDLIWTHRISEDIGTHFNLEDPEQTINLSEPRNLFILLKLEKDLEDFGKSVQKEHLQPTLKLSLSLVSLYLHELAISTDPPTDQPVPYFPIDAKSPDTKVKMAPSRPTIGFPDSQALSTAQLKFMTACLTAVDEIFETFLGMDVSVIRCVPVFNFVRVAYALVVLVRIYFASSLPGNDLASIINRDDLRIHHYLDAIIEKFRACGADEKSRPASKFLVVAVMLKARVTRQLRGGGEDIGGCPFNMDPRMCPPPDAAEAAAAAAAVAADTLKQSSTSSTPTVSKREDSKQHTPTPPPQQQQQQQKQKQVGGANLANTTPLHLLSEIATNDRSRSGGPGGSRANNNSNTNMGGGGGGGGGWGLGSHQPQQQQQQQQQQQHFLYNPAASGDTSGDAQTQTSTPYPSTAAPLPTTDPAFSVSHLIEDLSMQELMYSLGLDMSTPSFAGAHNFASQNVGFGTDTGPSSAAGSVDSGAAAGGSGGGGLAGVENGVRYAMANDPWFGQWGDVLQGMPQGWNGAGAGAGGAWGGAPPFQM